MEFAIRMKIEVMTMQIYGRELLCVTVTLDFEGRVTVTVTLDFEGRVTVTVTLDTAIK